MCGREVESGRRYKTNAPRHAAPRWGMAKTSPREHKRAPIMLSPRKRFSLEQSQYSCTRVSYTRVSCLQGGGRGSAQGSVALLRQWPGLARSRPLISASTLPILRSPGAHHHCAHMLRLVRERAVEALHPGLSLVRRGQRARENLEAQDLGRSARLYAWRGKGQSHGGSGTLWAEKILLLTC